MDSEQRLDYVVQCETINDYVEFDVSIDEIMLSPVLMKYELL